MNTYFPAAHCFYDESRNRREPPDDFVIVTNKFTRDYYKKDNEYQQRFKVHYQYALPSISLGCYMETAAFLHF